MGANGSKKRGHAPLPSRAFHFSPSNIFLSAAWKKSPIRLHPCRRLFMKTFEEANIMKLSKEALNMLNEQTLTTMHQLKLLGMAKGFSERTGRSDHAGLSHAEFVGLLVDDEKAYRQNARLCRLLKSAHLRQGGALEDG